MIGLSWVSGSPVARNWSKVNTPKVGPLSFFESNPPKKCSELQIFAPSIEVDCFCRMYKEIITRASVDDLSPKQKISLKGGPKP